jgi:hypothetical protein
MVIIAQSKTIHRHIRCISHNIQERKSTEITASRGIVENKKNTALHKKSSSEHMACPAQNKLAKS